MTDQLYFGSVPVPYTVSWSGENTRFFIDICPYSSMRAICQEVDRGAGKPAFGKPHHQRQREVIARDLCDLCGRTLKNRTKVSLSHARVRTNAAEGPAVLQVEPLLHRECAAESMNHCPSLKRDIKEGSLMIRQVSSYRVQFAIMGPEFVHHYVPDYVAKPTDRIVGAAKVELLGWRDRPPEWLP